MDKKIYTTERIYDGYLRVNSCGKCWSGKSDYEMSRADSRIAHFSRVFKKFTGHPPSYYKKV